MGAQQSQITEHDNYQVDPKEVEEYQQYLDAINPKMNKYESNQKHNSSTEEKKAYELIQNGEFDIAKMILREREARLACIHRISGFLNTATDQKNDLKSKRTAKLFVDNMKRVKDIYENQLQKLLSYDEVYSFKKSNTEIYDRLCEINNSLEQKLTQAQSDHVDKEYQKICARIKRERESKERKENIVILHPADSGN